MWEFLGDLLRSGDSVAILFTVTLAGCITTTRVLWNENQAINRQLRDTQEQYRRELSVLQEKRVAEAQEVTREVVAHVESTKNSVDHIRSAMEVLTDVMGNRRR
jgi:hypothetical protein